MKKNQIAQDALLDQLEYEINNYYGSEFLEDLQSVSGYSKQKKDSKDVYVNMMRGVWYGMNQKITKIAVKDMEDRVDNMTEAQVLELADLLKLVGK
jgi:hypothetical protein